MKRMIKRFIPCLIAATMCFGLVQASSFIKAEDTEMNSSIQVVNENNEVVNSTTVSSTSKEKETLVASIEGGTNYQWQILVSDDQWVDITGTNSNTINLSYAMIANLLNGGVAQVRCQATVDDQEVVSNPISVTVDDSVQQEEQTSTPAKARMVTFSDDNEDQSNQPMTLADGEGGTPATTTYNVVINYVFENNNIAADPYTASLAAGSNFTTTVNHPTVQGYLPYIGESTVTSTSIDLNITDIQADVTYTVTYKPTNVDYTVIHYQQNVDNDNYTQVAQEPKQGLTNSTVPGVANTYAGFYPLLYEKPAIAADGSTVVEVYYDRYYYLMNFDLDGGYGVEPIYARYGAKIENVGTPTKAGYEFKGWSLDGTTAVDLPETMPAGNVTYKALWEADKTAKVSIVIWGENADDEGYSYIKSSEIYAKPGSTITYGSNQLVCGLETHQHTQDECYELTCTTPEHDHVKDGCTLSCSHTSHTVDCYTVGGYIYSLKETTKPDENLADAGNGIWTYSNWRGTHYYVKIGETWYCAGTDLWTDDRQTITFNCTHTHTDSCYSCGLVNHTHSFPGCYTLTCDKQEHTHSDSCYLNTNASGMDTSLWTYVRSDEVTVAADGSTVMNVYFDRTQFTLTFKDGNKTVATITAKWGASISGKFSEAPFNTTYNGRAWECTESSKYGYALQTLDIMPKFNATFKLYDKSSNTLKTIYYYVENVGANVSENTWPSSTANFTLNKKVNTYFNYATYDEEYHEMEGFTRYSASIAGFSSNWKDFSKNNDLYLYYLRNSYTLDFNDGYDVVKSESVEYEESFAKFKSYTPEAPKAYEKGSVVFGGWYLNPECTGDPVNLDTAKMPADNMILYAKWVPVTHTVEFYLDKDAMTVGTKIGDTHPDLSVSHGSKVDKVPATPTNGNYSFIGWFYMEDGEEKAFDFANMPINKDLKVYGKWSSNVLKKYTIYYKIQGTDTDVATPTEGSGLAGITKTFDAKGETDLYTTYQEGYFPVVKSHSLTIDIENEANNTFTFWYIQKEAVPYTVKYLNKETGDPVADEKTVSDNRKAVVTETFVPVDGMMPDAYQKRLVVSGEEGAVNEIIFYYTEDTTHAYYKITHYTQNTDGETWTEYASSQAVGDIGKTYNADPMTIPGFTLDKTVEGTVASGELTENGLELKLYYTRNSYPYEVHYLEQGSGKQLANPKTGTDLYGKVISESAIDIANYTAVDPTSQTLTIKIEEGTNAKLNVINFYYKENEATINYVVIGPDGCGSLSNSSEELKVQTGIVQGSTPTANDTYKFVGWFTDDTCKIPVNSSWVDANTNKLTPEKGENDVWTDVTYYAKFEKNTVNITVHKDVTGAFGNRDEMFNFTYQIDDGEAKPFSLTDFDNDGHDDIKIIKDVPIGSTLTITESNADGYTTTLGYGPSINELTNIDPTETNGKTFNFTVTENGQHVVITNDKQAVPLTGIGDDNHSSLGMIGIIVVELGAIYLVLKKKRQLKM
ncbi:MAG: InlB B-repeat-containing protein [Erysipelotrichaceae bacterium]|nr:InlB B-repeat-containing protein [Erysipelotrichaceae bacterium]